MTGSADGAGAADGHDVLLATEHWFAHNGLAYFVPEVRAETRAALRWRRTVPRLVLVAVLAATAAVALALATGQSSFGPAAAWTVGGLAVAWYALTALHAGPIVRWALRRSLGSLRVLLPMTTRALPLLLLFVTFLFVNAEAWQVAAGLDGGVLWLVVLVFGTLSTLFLLVRLPEEVDRVDDDVTDDLVRTACGGTPLEAVVEDVLADPDLDHTAEAEVLGYERWNLVLVLLVVQATQVVLLAVGVFVFFVLFGALVMEPGIVRTWTGAAEHTIPYLPDSVSVELFQVSVFLAAFSTLYLTVSTVTDDSYRAQFFGSVVQEMERAVGVRAAYLALRRRGDGAAPEVSTS